MAVSENEFEAAANTMAAAVSSLLEIGGGDSPTKRAALLTRAQLVLTTAICQQALESAVTEEELPQEDVQTIARILRDALIAAEEERRRMELVYSVGGVKQ